MSHLGYHNEQATTKQSFGGLVGPGRFGGLMPGGNTTTNSRIGGHGGGGGGPRIGMNAFRNSGPVKAHRVCATRPSTAPSNRPTFGGIAGVSGGPGGSRPNSPLLQRSSGSGASRPGSPICGRPPSPSHRSGLGGGSMPQIGTGNFRTKSLSSHMRRAPSI